MRSRQQGKCSKIAAALTIIFTAGVLAGCATAPDSAHDRASATGQHWVASWGTAQLVPEAANELPAASWRDASMRQIVHLSLGGSQVRVRLTNVFGTAPLLVNAASVARAPGPGRADIDAATLQALTFDGRRAVTIPAGAEYYSDPVAIELPAGADLAISLHFPAEPARQTSHSGARTNSFLIAGNRTADATWPGAAKVARWFSIADVDVLAPHTAGALVAIGDSITDGYGVTTDGNNRWTDVLAARLRQDGMALGVVNAGIGGGRMLKDGLGPNLVSRFERDVLARAGVTHALVLIGVNDLGGLHRNTPDLPADRQQLLADLRLAHRQLAIRARERGICLIGATVTPYVGSDYYHPEPANEADRQELNAWIRTSGVFDAVVDFDAALRDPAQPQRMAPQYDSGDHLHPSLAGYRAMAEAVPLTLLRQSCRSRP